MKSQTTNLMITGLLLLLACRAGAQTVGSFAPVGIVAGQTGRLDVHAVAPNSCNGVATWQDASGNILKTAAISLPAGQSTTLDWKDTGYNSRTEITPSLVPTRDGNGNTGCLATTEVFDNLTGYTRVAINANRVLKDPGPAQQPAGPGQIGIGLFETARLNVTGVSPNSCIGQVSFTDAIGNALGSTLSVNLGPGQSTSLDLNGNMLVRRIGQRVQVQPVLTITPGTPSLCNASVEVYEQFFGTTMAVADPSPLQLAGRDPGPAQFGALGIAPGQTARLNAVAATSDPCTAQLEFTDASGNTLVSGQPVFLSAGQATSLDYQLAPGSRGRTEIIPAGSLSNPTGGTVAGCLASAEIFDNASGFSRVWVNPGPSQFAGKDPGPTQFGMFGVGQFQTLRLNAEGISSDPAVPCVVQLSFADGSANVLSAGPVLTLNQGQISFLELNGNSLVGRFGQRVQVRPVLTPTSAPGTCSASAEVYEQITGRTLVYGNEVSTQ